MFISVESVLEMRGLVSRLSSEIELYIMCAYRHPTQTRT